MGAWQVDRWLCIEAYSTMNRAYADSLTRTGVRGMDTQEWKIFALRKRELPPTNDRNM